MGNPTYKSKTAAEIALRQKEQKDIKARIEGLVKQASECINDPKFVEYKAALVEARAEVLKVLKTPMAIDPIQDAYYLRSVINTFNVLNQIIEMPKADAERKV